MWDKITDSTLNKAWNKFCDRLEYEEGEENNENLVEMAKVNPGCEEIEESEIFEWLDVYKRQHQNQQTLSSL